MLLPRAVDTALKPVRACATVVSSRYSAWRVHPALWIPAYAGMTGRSDGTVLFTLAFDSSPIKGEGIQLVGLYCCCPTHPPPLWIADQVRNDGMRRGRIQQVLSVACLPRPVDSRLRGNDGVLVLACFHPHLSPLPSRERGIGCCFVLRRPTATPLGCGSSPQ